MGGWGVSRRQVPWLRGPHPSPVSFLRAEIVSYLPLTHPWHREVTPEYEVSSTAARTGRTEIEREALLRETELEHLPRGCAVASRQGLGRAHRPEAETKLDLSSLHARGLPVSSNPTVADDLSVTHSQLWA